MAVANTLAYYDTATITAVKSFMVQAPEANQTRVFWSKFTHCFSKLDHLINEGFFAHCTETV
jgi:hypothetical protein